MIETSQAPVHHCAPGGHRIEGLTRAIDFLMTLQRAPALIAPSIHARWCARMLRLGFQYGSTTDARRRTHRLIKPLETFTSLERLVELMLVHGDLIAIEEALRAVPFGSSLMFADMSVSATLSTLSRDQKFLRTVAISTHENWRRVKLFARVDLDDSRVYRRFVDLTEAEAEVTLANVVIDIEAVASTICSSPPPCPPSGSS